MADHSGIEWTDATWNPIVGCTIVSPGCTNCYAMKMAGRIEAMRPGSHYAGTTQTSKAGAVWTGKVALAPEHILTQPLRWKRPRKIFVNSMGDLFHEDVPDEWIAEVFNVMAEAPQHTFQILTKRSKRMRRLMDGPKHHRDWSPKLWHRSVLPNVWLGVSAEDQKRAEERIPDLLATPAAVRFLSAEPLLGPIYIPEYMPNRLWSGLPSWKQPELDWVIAGGESGPGARPMHPDWARSLRDQCAASGVPFYFKQWGEWLPFAANPDQGWWHNETKQDRKTGFPKGEFLGSYCSLDRNGEIVRQLGPSPCKIIAPKQMLTLKVGKKAAGRLLDGIEHNAFPSTSSIERLS